MTPTLLAGTPPTARGLSVKPCAEIFHFATGTFFYAAYSLRLGSGLCGGLFLFYVTLVPGYIFVNVSWAKRFSLLTLTLPTARERSK